MNQETKNLADLRLSGDEPATGTAIEAWIIGGKKPIYVPIKPDAVIKIRRKTRGQIVAEEVRDLFPLLLIAGLALFLTWIGLRAGFGTPVTIEEIRGLLW